MVGSGVFCRQCRSTSLQAAPRGAENERPDWLNEYELHAVLLSKLTNYGVVLLKLVQNGDDRGQLSFAFRGTS